MTLGNSLNLYNSVVRNTCGGVFEALSNTADTVNTVFAFVMMMEMMTRARDSEARVARDEYRKGVEIGQRKDLLKHVKEERLFIRA